MHNFCSNVDKILKFYFSKKSMYKKYFHVICSGITFIIICFVVVITDSNLEKWFQNFENHLKFWKKYSNSRFKRWGLYFTCIRRKSDIKKIN